MKIFGSPSTQHLIFPLVQTWRLTVLLLCLCFIFQVHSTVPLEAACFPHQWLCGCMWVAGWTCWCECLCMPVSPGRETAGPMRHSAEMQGARSFAVRLLLLICCVFAAAGYPFKTPLDLDVTPRITVLSSGKHGHKPAVALFYSGCVLMGCKSDLIKILFY